MKVMELRTRIVVEVNDSYGARMIEQGKAVIPPKEAQEAAETPADGMAVDNIKGGKKR